MTVKNLKVWKCDLCNDSEESVETKYDFLMPQGWRRFELSERIAMDSGSCCSIKRLGIFTSCRKCSKPYENMPPIRKALSLFAWRKK